MAVLIELAEKSKLERRYFINSWANVDQFNRTLAKMNVSEEERSRILAEGQYVNRDITVVIKRFATMNVHDERGCLLTTSFGPKDKLIIYPDLEWECEYHRSWWKRIFGK